MTCPFGRLLRGSAADLDDGIAYEVATRFLNACERPLS
jgi:hypothetical protein